MENYDENAFLRRKAQRGTSRNYCFVLHNAYYESMLCAFVVRACVRVCVCVCLRACVCACMRDCVHVGIKLIYPLHDYLLLTYF